MQGLRCLGVVRIRELSVGVEASEDGFGSRVVAERLADVGPAVDVPWSKDKGGAELERVLAEFGCWRAIICGFDQ